MNDPLTPRDIEETFSKNEINIDEACHLLVSLYRQSKDFEIQLESIRRFKEICSEEEANFKLIESILISEENPLIRALAAEIILTKFVSYSDKVINWILNNELSPIVIQKIIHYLQDNPTPFPEDLLSEKEKYLSKVSEKIGIDAKELIFIIDLEAIMAYKNHFLAFNNHFFNYYKKILNMPIKYGWLEIENAHITKLSLSLFKWKFLRNSPEFYSNLDKYRDLDLLLSLFHNMNPIHQGLVSLLKSIANLSYLRVLDLSENNLSTLPEEIKNLDNLNRLDLSYNNFTEFPKNIYNLTNLRTLCLSDNLISSIPNEIKTISSLKAIHIERNRINSISDDILTFLKSLDHYIV